MDTSVLVAAMIRPHAMHARARPWLDRVIAHEFAFFVSAHSVAELFAVLTAYPIRPRIAPGEARQLIRHNIESHATIVSLSPSDDSAILDHLASMNLSGGVAYDALIVRAARKSGVDRLLTFEVDDMRRVWPDGVGAISAP
jgi:predicted nucleic acid-binding protein